MWLNGSAVLIQLRQRPSPALVPTQNSKCRRNARISLTFGVLSRDSLHRTIIGRRKEIENEHILAPIPGDEDRMRLLALVNLGARAKAAKVLAGSHLLASVWKPVPSCPFLYDAG